jgi:hypothetical protein
VCAGCDKPTVAAGCVRRTVAHCEHDIGFYRLRLNQYTLSTTSRWSLKSELEVDRHTHQTNTPTDSSEQRLTTKSKTPLHPVYDRERENRAPSRNETNCVTSRCDYCRDGRRGDVPSFVHAKHWKVIWEAWKSKHGENCIYAGSRNEVSKPERSACLHPLIDTPPTILNCVQLCKAYTRGKPMVAVRLHICWLEMKPRERGGRTRRRCGQTSRQSGDRVSSSFLE